MASHLCKAKPILPILQGDQRPSHPSKSKFIRGYEDCDLARADPMLRTARSASSAGLASVRAVTSSEKLGLTRPRAAPQVEVSLAPRASASCFTVGFASAPHVIGVSRHVTIAVDGRETASCIHRHRVLIGRRDFKTERRSLSVLRR